MDQIASDDLLLSYMPERIQNLANTDLPKLAKHKIEWKRFLWQRGLELDHQWQNSATGQEFHTKMSAFIDMLTKKDGFSNTFKTALKGELFNIFAHYDAQAASTPKRRAPEKADTFPPLSLAEPITPPSQNTPSLFSRFAAASLNAANKTDQIYTRARNALFGLTITATYTLYAAAAVDIAVNGADNSYTKRAVESFTSAPQNTPKP